MTQQGFDRFHSIRYKFVGIQFVSILLTVVLVCGISLSLFSEYFAKSQQEKLEAHAQSLSMEAFQLISQLETRLANIETNEFYKFHRVEVLVKSFAEHLAAFPKLAYFEESGQQLVKLLNGQVHTDSLLPLQPDVLKSSLARPNQVVIDIEEYEGDFASHALVLTQTRIGYFGDEFQGIIQAVIPLSHLSQFFIDRHLDEGIELVLTDAHGHIMLHSQPGKNLFAADPFNR